METLSKARNVHERDTLVNQIYREIRDRIFFNTWGDGHQVLELELAHELGVSRTPVREALIRLQRDGLIKVIPRHGILVLPMSPTDVRETYEILTSLESLAVELAASRKLTAVEIEPLERANQEMKSAHDASNFMAWAKADEQFHFLLVQLSGNKILVKVHENFWGQAQRARLAMLSLIKPPARSTNQHAKLIEAIRKGSPSLARERLTLHFEHLIRYVNNLQGSRFTQQSEI